jgi:hypothetical protein
MFKYNHFHNFLNIRGNARNHLKFWNGSNDTIHLRDSITQRPDLGIHFHGRLMSAFQEDPHLSIYNVTLFNHINLRIAPGSANISFNDEPWPGCGSGINGRRFYHFWHRVITDRGNYLRYMDTRSYHVDFFIISQFGSVFKLRIGRFFHNTYVPRRQWWDYNTYLHQYNDINRFNFRENRKRLEKEGFNFQNLYVENRCRRPVQEMMDRYFL